MKVFVEKSHNYWRFFRPWSEADWPIAVVILMSPLTDGDNDSTPCTRRVAQSGGWNRAES